MELFTPDFGLIFWMFVSFAILFVILWRWGWPAIMKGVSDRADLIDKGVEYAQNAKEQLDHAREEADKHIADARRQQAEMLREADKMKSQIIEEARNEARQAAKKEMDAARASIEQERKAHRTNSATKCHPSPSTSPRKWCATSSRKTRPRNSLSAPCSTIWKKRINTALKGPQVSPPPHHEPRSHTEPICQGTA